ncbi:MAG: 1-acyl-sn-glycerol-3-phosphate acyltransferase [Actinomycetota bacterium]
MTLPPRIVRRLVIAPLVLLVTFLAITTLPLWLFVALIVTPFFPGRWRLFRLLAMALVYLVYESIGIILLTGLWVWSGFGARMKSDSIQEQHYELMRWFLTGLYRVGVRLFKLEVELDMPGGSLDLSGLHRRPLLVFARHAGPGDSFLIAYGVLVQLHRRTRIVLKDTLRLDPCIDIVLGRLPNRFITPNPKAGEDIIGAIGELAEGMDERDALIIFPEGGNFTERRRVRAIERLRRRGHHDEADKASLMRNVLPPRPGGALAAIAATPVADIMFVAHTGLDHLDSLVDIWRGIPMDQSLKVRWWIVPEEELPEGQEERIDWLFEHWAAVDEWIEANKHPSA